MRPKQIVIVLACLCLTVHAQILPSVATVPASRALKVFKQRLAKAPRQTGSKDRPMALTVTSRAGVVVSPQLGSAGWSPTAGASGYVLRWSLDGTNYYWSADAGPNTNVTFVRPGGFPYKFTIQSYMARQQTNGSRVVTIKTYSPQSAPVTFVPALPLNSPQLLVAVGKWYVMAQSVTGGQLMTSQDLRTWTAVGPLPVNAPAEFQGLLTTKQFFKITPL